MAIKMSRGEMVELLKAIRIHERVTAKRATGIRYFFMIQVFLGLLDSLIMRLRCFLGLS